MNRQKIADLIVEKIKAEKYKLQTAFQLTKNKIGYFYIDNLLPVELAERIHASFPAPELMKPRKSLREYKYIAAQMDQYDPILEEAIYAFQDPRIIELISDICGIDTLTPDEHLYAGGISLMRKGQFLNPHLDNSHDKDQKQWRVLNLLYYVTPDWQNHYGGNLEVWPDGLKMPQKTIESLFNRLAVMTTHGSSWHSVSPVLEDKQRTCISNYYFSDTPLKNSDSFHVTSFRGRPEQKIVDVILQADIALRQGIRKLFPKGIVKTKHLYKK